MLRVDFVVVDWGFFCLVFLVCGLVVFFFFCFFFFLVGAGLAQRGERGKK